MTTQELWTRIETWLGARAPDILADLRAGATPDDIAAAERQLEAALPPDVAASCAVHDGSRGGAPPLFGEWRPMSLELVVREWSTLRDLNEGGTFEGLESDADPRVNDGWWRPGWIPVLTNESGDFECADVDPAAGGTPGQLVGFRHAEPAREVVADSFEARLRTFADDLEADRYRVTDGRLLRSA